MDLYQTYRWVRRATEQLCAPLAVEDFVVQAIPDASPTRWHLAHTTWFWEEFALKAFVRRYPPSDPRYGFLFNSYYESVGPRHARPERGLLSRPTVAEVFAYRRHVDGWMEQAFSEVPAAVVELGLAHEEQHQELILTDLKQAFGLNPLRPAYRPARDGHERVAGASRFVSFRGGFVDVGHSGDGFAFDNERPRHRLVLAPFELQNRLVTCGEYLAFMEDGGYRQPGLWLSDGWDACQRLGWEAPLYWERDGRVMTLSGMRAIDLEEPVCHVSFYEADAFARWAGARLPLEAEWEQCAADAAVQGNLLESEALHPRPTVDGPMTQLYGDVWEWTASAYLPYPGYAAPTGAFGEYNGKFMCNRMVLRGGSCVTPRRHLRPTYRNFFPPETRWQFSGIRLAR